MVLDKDKIKESLSKEDIQKILRDLGGGESKEDRQGNLIFQTVCHGGSSHKLYYYQDNQIFNCYTDCGDSFDVYDLVIRAKKQKGYDYSFYQSVQYVSNLTGKNFTVKTLLDEVKDDIIDDWDWINKFQKKKKLNVELPTYDERVLDVFLKLPHQSWLDEGISYETMQKFKIGYYFRETQEAIVIPHYDIDGNLIGIRRRSMLQEDIENGKKYMPLTIQNKIYNHPTFFNLYGLHKTKNAVRRLKKACIFEGEKSVLKCEDFYNEDNFSMACCSSNISNYHRDLLISLGVEEVFIAFDKYAEDDDEEKIIEYQERLKRLATKFAPFMKVYVLWDDNNLLGYKESPADRGKEVLEELMRNKIEITTAMR